VLGAVDPSPDRGPGKAGEIAVDWSLAQVGTPYICGGETPGSASTAPASSRAAYKVAGITLPRVAQDQYDATTKLGPEGPLDPGDLVFFGGGPTDITHVGIYIGNGLMVDAPHTGVDVRVESFPPPSERRGGRMSTSAPPIPASSSEIAAFVTSVRPGVLVHEWAFRAVEGFRETREDDPGLATFGNQT
jgi:hypothetical protein